MKLIANGYRWNGHENLQATITLLSDDGSPLWEDSVNLSKQASRARCSKILQTRFPELKGKDLESQFLQFLWGAKSQQEQVEEESAGRSERESQAKKLVRVVEENHVELFHTSIMVSHAVIPIESHREIYRCRSSGFKQWLSRQLWLKEEKIPNSDALNSAITAIEGKANFDGKEHALHNRVAFLDGAIWYDLSNKAWEAVKITPNHWEIVNNPPILFARYRHQKAQVDPSRLGDAKRLLDFVNLKGEDQELLFLVYVASCFIPHIPHPLHHPFGPQGAAKTTMHRIITRLVDPSAEELLILSHNINELAQKLYHHWICFFDNVSSLTEWQSDMLSRVVTGIGFGKRELYSDEGDIIWEIKRVVGINGINVVVAKPDLLDRCLLQEVERVSRKQRKGELGFLAEFEEAKPQILGGFFDLLSKAMAIHPTLELEVLDRMADFSGWGAAIAKALGYSPDHFVDVYTANIQRQNIELLASSPVASVVLALMEGQDTWEGTPAELLEQLEMKAEIMKIKTKGKTWPATPNVLTRRLNEVRNNFCEVGIEVETGGGSQQDGKWSRRTRIWKKTDTALPKSSQNSVGIVVPSESATAPYLEKTDGMLTVPLVGKQKTNATPTMPTVGGNVALGRPLSDQEEYQEQSNSTNDTNDKLATSWKADDVIFQSLGMTRKEALAIWESQGRQIIHLGLGENCPDLMRLLAEKEIKPKHLSAVRGWLEKHQGILQVEEIDG